MLPGSSKVKCVSSVSETIAFPVLVPMKALPFAGTMHRKLHCHTNIVWSFKCRDTEDSKIRAHYWAAV